MTFAVLLAAEGIGLADKRVAGLRDQLHEAGVRDVRIDPGGDLPTQLSRLAELACTATTPVLLCGTDVMAHTAALRNLATEPGNGTVALVGPAAGSGAARYAAVRAERGLIGEAHPPGHTSADSFLGALRVAVADLPALAECARRLAVTPTDGAAAASVLDLLLPALTGSGRRVSALHVRLLVADRAATDAEVAAVRTRLVAVDEEKARLRLAVKERDDFFTTYFVSSISPYVVRLSARLGLSPTVVTGISVALAIVAAVGFGWGTRFGLVAGAVLLYVSFLLDCVDGQLARYSRQFSAFGGWLDTMADRSKEYVVYAGLAVGAERAGLGTVWPLALAAMVLQTVRHMTDTWYGALHDEAVARRAAEREVVGGAGGVSAAAGGGAAPVGEPAGVAGGGPAGTAGGTSGGSRVGLGAVLGRASERVQADTGSLAYWLKRIIVFPIGERWALIALTAALFHGRVTLIAVLAWGGFAAAYTLCLRSLRARAMRVPVLASVDTSRHRDDGPLVRWLGTWVVGRVALRPWLAPLAWATMAALIAGPFVLAAGSGALDEGNGAPAVLAVGLAVILCAGSPSRTEHTGALDWLIPAALRAAEYLFVVGVCVLYGVPWPLTFALLFALALRHYDLTARMEKHAAEAPVRPWDLGWDGRVAVLAVAAAVGAAGPAVAILTGYVGAMFLIGVWGAWVGAPTVAGDVNNGPGR